MMGRKLKVDKANIIGFDDNNNSGRNVKVKAGSNITIIKSSNHSPSSSVVSSNNMRVRSPISNASGVSGSSAAKANPMNIIRPGVPFNSNNINIGSTALNRRSSSRTSSTSNDPLIQRNNMMKSPKPLNQNQILQTLIQIKNMQQSDDNQSNSPEISEESEHGNSDMENSEVSNSSFSTDITNVDNLAIEARVNRKILDLEISNKSLLAINNVLESKVRNMGEQIESMKKTLQGYSRGEVIPLTCSSINTDDEDEISDDEDEKKYNRIVSSFDRMLEEAKTAINFTPNKNAGKVLPSHAFTAS